MERRQVEYFIGVVETGGFGAAAEMLHVAQSTVSHALRLLERELGCQLFERLATGVRLTDAGRRFEGPARDALHSFDAASAVAKGVGADGIGDLSIGCLPQLTEGPLPRIVTEFRKRHPAARLSIRAGRRVSAAGGYVDLITLLRAGECDVALLAVESAPSDMGVVPVGAIELVAVLPPGSPLRHRAAITVAELLASDLVVEPWWESTATAQKLRALCPPARHRIAVRSPYRDSFVAYVTAGIGATIAPPADAERARLHGCAIARIAPPLIEHAAAVYRRRYVSEPVRAFLEICLHEAHDSLWSAAGRRATAGAGAPSETVT